MPSSFVPVEDLGYFITTVTLPEAASSNRTREVVNNIAAQIHRQAGVTDEMAITGYDLMGGGAKPNVGLIYTRLAPWDERKTADLQVAQKIQKVFMDGSHTPESGLQADRRCRGRLARPAALR